MENRELKACPFCGEEPTMTTVGNTSSNYDVGFDFYVKCYGCGISLPKEHPELGLDDGNLVSLCTQCHNLRHGRAPKRFARKKKLVSMERW